MSRQENRKRTIESYLRAYNNFETENMLRDLDENLIFRNVSNGEITLTTAGVAEFKNQAEQAAKLFSQREQRAGEMKFGESAVEVEIFYTGTLAADLSPAMKRGDRIELHGKSVFRFAGEKIIEIEDVS